MKIRDFGLFTDENLDSDVVQWLRQTGFDVYDVCENGLQGSSDFALLKLAAGQNRLIVTHDSDFGTLAVWHGEPVVGLIYCVPAISTRSLRFIPSRSSWRSIRNSHRHLCSLPNVRRTTLWFAFGQSSASLS